MNLFFIIVAFVLFGVLCYYLTEIYPNNNSENRPHQEITVDKSEVNNKEWTLIENLNANIPFVSKINSTNCYIDEHGYLRWKSNHKLCHREIAYLSLYRDSKIVNRYSDCVIHHKDGNKWNNQVDNLEILTPQEHSIKHGYSIYKDKIEYKRLCKISNIITHNTEFIQIRSRGNLIKLKTEDVLIKDGYLYASEWATVL